MIYILIFKGKKSLTHLTIIKMHTELPQNRYLSINEIVSFLPAQSYTRRLQFKAIKITLIKSCGISSSVNTANISSEKNGEKDF